MKNNHTLDSQAITAIEKKIIDLEKENQVLKSKIKEIHINDAILLQNYKQITSSCVYKAWRIYKLFHNLLLQRNPKQ